MRRTALMAFLLILATALSGCSIRTDPSSDPDARGGLSESEYNLVTSAIGWRDNTLVLGRFSEGPARFTLVSSDQGLPAVPPSKVHTAFRIMRQHAVGFSLPLVAQIYMGPTIRVEMRYRDTPWHQHYLVFQGDDADGTATTIAHHSNPASVSLFFGFRRGFRLGVPTQEIDLYDQLCLSAFRAPPIKPTPRVYFAQELRRKLTELGCGSEARALAFARNGVSYSIYADYVRTKLIYGTGSIQYGVVNKATYNGYAHS
jgi:hypothetical protein